MQVNSEQTAHKMWFLKWNSNVEQQQELRGIAIWKAKQTIKIFEVCFSVRK